MDIQTMSKDLECPTIDDYLAKLDENEDILTELLDEIEENEDVLSNETEDVLPKENEPENERKLPENDIISQILDEIDSNEKDEFEIWIKKQWNIGSKVELYSASTNNWSMANIIGIFTDSVTGREWLEVQYAVGKRLKIKNITRDDAEIRPFSKSIGIYQYVYSSLKTNLDIAKREQARDPLPIQITPAEMQRYRDNENSKNAVDKSYLIIDCRKDLEIQDQAILAGNDWIHIPMDDILENATSKSYLRCLTDSNNTKIEHLFVI